MAPQVETGIAPIVVHYNFRPYLRICRDVQPRQISAGVLVGTGQRWSSTTHKQSLADYCGLILFAFDESQKLQRKDFSG
jgi:hypothetical protein